MLEPEISRRCPDCGCAIRERAVFCPQCGRDLKQAVEENPAADKVAVVEESNSSTPLAAETLAESAGAVETAADEQRRLVTTPLSSRTVSLPESEPTAVRPLVVQSSRTPMEDRGHRASTVAREVIEDGLLRVERLRKVSSVMIDQAAYDPSLRFVLVAVFLFAIFLVLLLLNELIG